MSVPPVGPGAPTRLIHILEELPEKQPLVSIVESGVDAAFQAVRISLDVLVGVLTSMSNS